jgi:hypothetical protein
MFVLLWNGRFLRKRIERGRRRRRSTAAVSRKVGPAER